MFNVIQKEVTGNIDKWIQMTQRFSIKLAGFVISCWLIIGSIGIGLIAPVYVAKALMKTQWVGEAQASTTPEVQPRWHQENRRDMRPSIVTVKRPILSAGLREVTTNVNEIRRLSQGLTSLVSN